MAEREEKNVRAFQSGQLREAMKDILGHVPKSFTLEFDQKDLRQAVQAEPGEWSGNIYKYSY